MIRVNLMKNRVGDAGTGATAAIAQPSNEPSHAREIVAKIAVILLGPIALYVYQGIHLRALDDEKANVTAEVARLTQEAAAKAAEADSVKDIEGQAKELEAKLKILKLLSHLRLREVKTLDFMQSSIPEKVWLKAIHYESVKDQVDVGHFTFEGGAMSTDDLAEFAKRLENSAYLSDVIIVKNQEIAMQGKSTTTRDFLFTAEVENQN